MNDQIESTFQLPPELQDVPHNYSMTHITFEDVQGMCEAGRWYDEGCE